MIDKQCSPIVTKTLQEVDYAWLVCGGRIADSLHADISPVLAHLNERGLLWRTVQVCTNTDIGNFGTNQEFKNEFTLKSDKDFSDDTKILCYAEKYITSNLDILEKVWPEGKKADDGLNA